MPRYIDAEKIEYFPLALYIHKFTTSERIDRIPTADVAPVVHGHWIRESYFPDGTPAWVCSRCGHPEEIKYSHCNCGAKMDETDTPIYKDTNYDRS